MRSKNLLVALVSLALVGFPVPAMAATPDTPMSEESPASASSSETTQPLEVALAPKVTVEGTPKVGKVLTATGSHSGAAAMENTVSYTWKRGSSEVAAGPKYTVTEADAGQTLTVVYTVGYQEQTASAEAKVNVDKIEPTVKAVVSVSGTAKVGKALKASGSSTFPKGLKKSSGSYTWYVGAKKVGTGSSYTVKSGDWTKKIKVTYTVKWEANSKYTAGKKSASVKTAAIKKSPSVKANVSISGTAKVGKTLKASGSSTFPKGLKKSSGSYAWYVGDKKVGKGSTYVVQSTDAGKKIKVTYTVKWKATSKYSAGKKSTSTKKKISSTTYNCGFTGGNASPKVGDEKAYCIQVDKEQSKPNNKLDAQIKKTAKADKEKAGKKGSGKTTFGNPFTFKAPVTSHFGWRMHPILGYRKLHDGTDFGAYCGSAQYATKAGTVYKTGSNLISGKYVVINHGVVNGRSWMTKHSHLESISVTKGKAVKRSTIVGRTGTTGRSTGCHLHLSLYKDGEKVDVLEYM